MHRDLNLQCLDLCARPCAFALLWHLQWSWFIKAPRSHSHTTASLQPEDGSAVYEASWLPPDWSSATDWFFTRPQRFFFFFSRRRHTRDVVALGRTQTLPRPAAFDFFFFSPLVEMMRSRLSAAPDSRLRRRLWCFCGIFLRSAGGGGVVRDLRTFVASLITFVTYGA